MPIASSESTSASVPLFATTLQPQMDQILERVAVVARSGRYIFGPELEAFEGEFAGYLGVEHAIGVGNGTDALTIALRATGVKPGDEVICPSFTFYATSEAIARAGATPVFADIDPITLNLDPRRRLRGETAAIHRPDGTRERDLVLRAGRCGLGAGRELDDAAPRLPLCRLRGRGRDRPAGGVLDRSPAEVYYHG